MENNKIFESVIAWARENKNVIALIQTGSFARNDKYVDEYSDYDLEVIADDVDDLLKDNSWYHQFGKVIVNLNFDEDIEFPTRLVVYKGGLKIDFTIADKNRITDMIEKGLDDLYKRGYLVCVDKKFMTDELPKATGKDIDNTIPTEKEYIEICNEFWFEASQIPKYIARRELWVVKFRDWTMKKMVLQMLEMKARFNNKDPWYIGLHMEDWVDKDDWDTLQTLFVNFDQKDSKAGLIKTIEFFRKISQQVAKDGLFEYPKVIDEEVSEYIYNFKFK